MNAPSHTCQYLILAGVIVCLIYLIAYERSYINSEAVVAVEVTSSAVRKERNIPAKDFLPPPLPKFWIWEPQPPKARSKVLVWGYFRGGSSFSSQLISVNNDTVYFFEPLWLFEKIEEEKDKGDFIQRVFNCDDDLMDEMKKHNSFLLPLNLKSRDECMEAGVIVAKVNRLYGEEPLEWLLQDPSIKILHIFRDPRAIYRSRKKFGDMQKGASASAICDKMRGDLNTLETLPKERYLRVRLEDIVENPIETSKIMYEFTDQKFTQKVEDYLEEHSTETPLTSNHKAFLKKLSSEELTELDKHCNDIINKLMY